MKRAACIGLVGVLIGIACAFQVPTPQKKGTFKAISETDIKKALSADAKVPRSIWKPICTLGPTRLADGGNHLLISDPMYVSSVQTNLNGVPANPNSGLLQGSISVYFYVPRAGKVVGLAFDLGVLNPTPLTEEFEFGAFDHWTKKTATIPGTVVTTFKPTNTGLHVMVIKMSSNGSFLFKSVKVYQEE